ncbi:hypothetical protein BJ165DRAFT_636088 [Panaeolus papilionaceus]|nr:hypothetical protein BJ165DRAFT_636088 [Panaeolus papilionaceus]
MFDYDKASPYVHQEVEHFCNFPNSSYGASVERFLSQVPLSTFIQLARWIVPLWASFPGSNPAYTLFRHLAALIKPHIQPHLKDPDSFARFLCWAAYVPGSRLSTQGHRNPSSNHRWPADLRRIVLVITVLHEESRIYQHLYDSELFTLSSIPSMKFLCDALLIVLKSLELGLRDSRRWKYPEIKPAKWWQGPRDRAILRCIFRVEVSLDIWIYVLDCEQTFQDDFRTNIQKFLGFDDESLDYKINHFQCLHNPQHAQDSGVVSPLDFALAECTWNVDSEPIRSLLESEHYPFLRNDQYPQILIPCIPELAVYLKLHDDDRYISDPPFPVKASLCSCGWADFTPLTTDV